jgi:hypothetical protein
VYGELDPAGRVLAHQLFGRLVHVVDHGRVTRRQVARAELALSGADGQPIDVGEVLSRFVEQRLITADAEHVEITHEALLDAWPRLRSWIDADRDRLRAHRQLTEAAEIWRSSGRDPAALLRGGRLAARASNCSTRRNRSGSTLWKPSSSPPPPSTTRPNSIVLAPAPAVSAAYWPASPRRWWQWGR